MNYLKIYTIIIAVLSLFYVISCSGDSKKEISTSAQTPVQAAVSDTVATSEGDMRNVEKEYLLFSQADENARIMAANRVFAALDKEEFTDSLTIFPAEANLDFVNYNTYYWMGE